MTFQVQKKTSDVQQEVSSVQQDVRALLDIMAKDMRQAGCDPTMSGTPGLTAASSGLQEIAFTSDLNGDGDTADTDETVTYTYTGTTLTRSANGVAAELSTRVTTFGLVYYDVNNAVITPSVAGAGGVMNLSSAQALTVRSVQVTIEIQSSRKDPDTNDYIKRSMTRQLKMRNLGL